MLKLLQTLSDIRRASMMRKEKVKHGATASASLTTQRIEYRQAEHPFLAKPVMAFYTAVLPINPIRHQHQTSPFHPIRLLLPTQAQPTQCPTRRHSQTTVTCIHLRSRRHDNHVTCLKKHRHCATAPSVRKQTQTTATQIHVPQSNPSNPYLPHKYSCHKDGHTPVWMALMLATSPRQHEEAMK